MGSSGGRGVNGQPTSKCTGTYVLGIPKSEASVIWPPSFKQIEAIENICFKQDRLSKRSLKYFFDKHQIIQRAGGFIIYTIYKTHIRIYDIAVCARREPMDWVRLLEDSRIEYVTRGPNTKRGEVSVRCPFVVMTTHRTTWVSA